MKKYRVYTRTHGNHDVTAETARQAVSCVVARLKLTEQEAMQTIRWAVSTDKPGKGDSDAAAT